MSSFSINTNLNALQAQRQLSRSDRNLQERLDSIASALRINSSDDDAAGLAISEKLRGQIRGDNQALQNIQDGISLIQTAEGGSQQIQENLQRIRELSLRAANDSLGQQEREAIQAEVDQITEEIDRLSDTVEFNGRNLLNGDISQSNGGAQIQAGSNRGETVNVTVEAQDASSLGVSGVDVTSRNGAENAVETVTGSINQVSTDRASLGAQENRLQEAIDFVQIEEQNQQAAESRIRDADLAQETTGLAQSRIRLQAGTSTLAQANNLSGQTALQLLG